MLRLLSPSFSSSPLARTQLFFYFLRWTTLPSAVQKLYYYNVDPEFFQNKASSSSTSFYSLSSSFPSSHIALKPVTISHTYYVLPNLGVLVCTVWSVAAFFHFLFNPSGLSTLSLFLYFMLHWWYLSFLLLSTFFMLCSELYLVLIVQFTFLSSYTWPELNFNFAAKYLKCSPLVLLRTKFIFKALYLSDV
jgi:hypothetical protein